MSTTAPQSTRPDSPRITLQTLREMRDRREPIAMLTAYDHPTAQLLARAGLHILLVGDSVATTVLGHDSTTKVTLEFLLTITDAVRRGAPGVFLMADMPFGSYPDIPTAVANAARFVREAGADCIKLEADVRHAPIVAGLAAAGIAVCAHIGLLPQRAPQQGGFKAQGRTRDDASRLLADASALAEAGSQLLLLEAVPDDVTARVVERVDIPVLGCGAGPSAHGHVIVTNDLLGFNPRPPRFAEVMADMPALLSEAARRYVTAVHDRTYPAEKHQYHMKAEQKV
jgi:3-methyl-2-oxobutanoate hydroxymethyltransferase